MTEQSESGSNIPAVTRLPGTSRRRCPFVLLNKAKKSLLAKLAPTPRTKTEHFAAAKDLISPHSTTAPPTPSTPNTTFSATPPSHTDTPSLEMPRQDSLFKTSVTSCGANGIPNNPHPKTPYTPDEIKQTITTTIFTVDATHDITDFWLNWLKSLGDDNAAYVRNLEITVKGVGEMALSIVPGRRGGVGYVDFVLSFAREGMMVGGREKLHADVEKWLEESFEDIRAKRRLLFGRGPFSRKEINKIGKVVFRLPAVVHEMVLRESAGEGGEKRESSIEHYGDKEEMGLADLVEGAQGSDKTQTAQRERDSFVQDELAFRRHAETCTSCALQWTAQLDGNSAVYSHKVNIRGKNPELVLERCDTPIPIICEPTCDTSPTTTTHPA